WSEEAYNAHFHPDKGFDPAPLYTIEPPQLTGPSGRKLESFKATFKALPSIEVAGKTIHYKPEKGHARAIAMQPSYSGKIGGAQIVTIVYDQPVDIGLARKLVSVTSSGGKKVPVALFHPGGSVTD